MFIKVYILSLKMRSQVVNFLTSSGDINNDHYIEMASKKRFIVNKHNFP